MEEKLEQLKKAQSELALEEGEAAKYKAAVERLTNAQKELEQRKTEQKATLGKKYPILKVFN